MGKKREIANIVIEQKLAGKKVIEILRDELKISNRQIKKIIFTKGLFLNKRPIHSEYKVKIGEKLSVKIPLDEQVKVEPVSMELSIIYEDEWFLAINKPIGINVHNTRAGEAPALVNGVVHYFMNQNKIITPRPLHRLDRDTSGVVLFAKSAEVQREVAKKWGTDSIKKTYWALVEGIVTEEGTIDASLKGKKAKTYFSPIEIHQALTGVGLQANFTELILKITTGRTHQIRKHLRLIGHPILGDRIYNDRSQSTQFALINESNRSGCSLSVRKNSALTVNRLALHAFVLELIHPRTDRRLHLEAPIPRKEFNDIL